MIFYTSLRLIPLVVVVLHVMALVASPLQEPGLLPSLVAPLTSVLPPQSVEPSEFPPTVTAKSFLKIRQENEGLETCAFENGSPSSAWRCPTGSNCAYTQYGSFNIGPLCCPQNDFGDVCQWQSTCVPWENHTYTSAVPISSGRSLFW